MTIVRLLDLRREYIDTSAVLGDLCEEHGGRERVPAERLCPFVRVLAGLARQMVDVDLSHLGVRRREGETAAIAVDQRPGSWFGDKHSDGRMLTQEQTEILIRSELHGQTRWLMDGPTPQNEDLMALLGEHRLVELLIDERKARASRQRGGISIDPVIRMLAFRAWCDRDEQWFERARWYSQYNQHPMPRPVRVEPAEPSFSQIEIVVMFREQIECSVADEESDRRTDILSWDRAARRLAQRSTLSVEDAASVFGWWLWLREQAEQMNSHGLFKLESTTKAPVASDPAFRPGMRRPGAKSAPPIPKWARKRRGDRW